MKFRVALLVVFLLVPAGASIADRVTLRNGNIVEGRIERELSDRDPKHIHINTGTGVLKLLRSNIATMEESSGFVAVQRGVEQSLRDAEQMLQRGQKDRALDAVVEGLNELERAEKGSADPLPAELLSLREQLEAARARALPDDPNSRRAEDLFQQAQDHLDHVEYKKAYDLLRESASLAPSRADIQIELGRVAANQRDATTAILAYRQALDLNPSTYYAECSVALLPMVQERGRRLVAERRSSEALDDFAFLLLLRPQQAGINASEPVVLADFLARRAERAKAKEDEILLEVYRFADDNDLVDLAFAAIDRVEKLRPDSPEVRLLRIETQHLARVNAAIAQGNFELVAELEKEIPKELKDSERIVARIERLAGEKLPELQAAELLAEAKQSFEREEYGKTIELCDKLMLDHAERQAAGDAAELRPRAELEAKIKPLLAKAVDANKAARDRDAEVWLRELLEIEDAASSRHYEEAQRLLRRLPDERVADELWLLAKTHLDVDEFDEALERLDVLASRYPDTRSGKKAATWLSDYRRRLEQEINRYRPVESDWFTAITDPNLWRAAEYPAPAGRGQLRRGAVQETQRAAAIGTFRELVAQDAAQFSDTRDPVMLVAVPLGGSGMVILLLLWWTARPGSGQYRAPGEVSEESREESGAKANPCRMCGQAVHASDSHCPACQTPVSLNEVESLRQADHDRKAEFDPWELRTSEKNANEFEEHFRRAKDMAETSDVQAAIDACRQALHEDPLRAEGYRLLAGLYERSGQMDLASTCYRELLFIDPADRVIREKLESTRKPPQLSLGWLPYPLSAAFWWALYWVVQAIDPGAHLLRAPAAVAGAALTSALLFRMTRNRRQTVEPKQRSSVDLAHPLPKADLSWREQARQAQYLAETIATHTGVVVPPLKLWRPMAAGILTFLAAVALTWASWTRGTAWPLLAVPGFLAVYFYLLDVHPRLLAAIAILRHCWEETFSLWVDPHRPFRARGEQVEGEFRVRSASEIPLRWALQPMPFPSTRQGVLNSLQQTLNRHWEFHRFYAAARVTQPFEINLPGGFAILTVASLLLLIGCLGGAGWLAWTENRERQRVEDAALIGYQFLLAGEIDSALERLRESATLDPRRFTPHLYLAHCYAAVEHHRSAEVHFRRATERCTSTSTVLNDFGNFLQRRGRLRDAVQRYREALRIDEANPDILNNAGSALYKLNDFADAADMLQRAVKADPTHSRAWTTLGLCLEALGDRPAAREAYEKAVAVAPDLPYTRIAKGRLAMNLEAEDERPLRLE